MSDPAPPRGYLAVDLGAESGRVMLAAVTATRITLREVHRFANLPLRLPTGLHWDVTALWLATLEGLRRGVLAARDDGLELRSVGVDAWGVDHALLGASGELLGIPFCYRDARNGPAFARAIAAVGREEIHRATGIQFMPINTLYQLVAESVAEPERLAIAHRLLFVPDLIHHLLCGSTEVEATIASTSQMIDPRTGLWALGLLERLRIPTRMCGPIVPPGTRLGSLLPHVADAVGAALPVVTPAAHDTASAVVAVPAEASSSWCFLSSGTWSLLGAEVSEPFLGDAARDLGFTNEGGVGGTFRLLKNVTGLWLVQECRRAFGAELEDLDHAALEAAAFAAEPLRTLIDPDDPPFREPGDMPGKIAAFAARTGQPVPRTPGEHVRCCLESLALAYRDVLARLESVLDRRCEVIHVVGGGARSALLNQLTASATGRDLLVGPVEATALGNALVQAIADGAVASVAAARTMVRASEPPIRIAGGDAAAWDAAAERFAALGRVRRDGG